MAQYNYFWDLASSQAYTNHTVKQLDANATTGGGTFKWVSIANNTTIDNIPGIRIKPTANTKGYWERVIDGPWLVDWFGCVNTSGQSTLTGYGLSAGDIAARFNCVTRDVTGTIASASNTIVGTDTYDTAAMKLAFNLMELGYTSAIQFLNKDYYISNTCNLPLAYYTAAARSTNPFVITGNSAQIITHSSKNTTSFTFWNRNIVDQSSANTQINTRFSIDNLNFKGYAVGAVVYQVALDLRATTNSKLFNLSFTNLLGGAVLRYCLDAQLASIDCTDVQRGINITVGAWTGGTNLNSASKNCVVNKFRYTFNAAYTSIAGIEVLDSDGISINDSTISTVTAGGTSGIILQANITVPTFKVTSTLLNINSTVTPAQGIGINLIPYNTNVQLDNISNTTACTLIKSDGLNVGTHNITVRNINNINASSQFENSTTNNYWVFENCKVVDPLSNTRWVGGVSGIPTTGAWVADGAVVGGATRLREAYPFAAK